jgi:hypothetical protein
MHFRRRHRQGTLSPSTAASAAEPSAEAFERLASDYLEARVALEKARDRIALLEDRVHTAEAEREQLAHSIITRELTPEDE